MEKLGLEVRVLGHPVALRIVDFLTKHSAYTAKDLSDKLPLPLEVVTYHLLSLETQGLVSGTLQNAESRSGTNVVKIYSVVPEKVNKVLEELRSMVSTPQ